MYMYMYMYLLLLLHCLQCPCEKGCHSLRHILIIGTVIVCVGLAISSCTSVPGCTCIPAFLLFILDKRQPAGEVVWLNIACDGDFSTSVQVEDIMVHRPLSTRDVPYM